MGSEEMRLDVELFINTGLKEGTLGWPVRSRRYGQPETRCWSQVGHRKHDRSLLVDPVVETGRPEQKKQENYRRAVTISEIRPLTYQNALVAVHVHMRT